jgi:L-lactate dehydrogenase
MNKARKKISVIGAGNVGATIAYSIAMRNMVSDLAIIDVMKHKAEGEAMDISHGLMAMGEMNIHSGEYEDVANSDIIILAAGVGRKPGETRLDLAKKNVDIIKDITQNVMKHYNGGAIMVVSNPVDVTTYIVTKESGLPIGAVFGTGTTLDSARFRYILSKRAGVDVKNVHGFMSGEHGDSQFAAWSSVHIAGMRLEDYCKETGLQIDRDAIENEVKYAGAEVIKRKGATFYAIASTVAALSQNVLKDQKSIHQTSVLVSGDYGLSDVCLSLPRVIGAGGAERTIHFNYTAGELAKLRHSAGQIQAILKQL